jgi:hypothetical protein
MRGNLCHDEAEMMRAAEATDLDEACPATMLSVRPAAVARPFTGTPAVGLARSDAANLFCLGKLGLGRKITDDRYCAHCEALQTGYMIVERDQCLGFDGELNGDGNECGSWSDLHQDKDGKWVGPKARCLPEATDTCLSKEAKDSGKRNYQCVCPNGYEWTLVSNSGLLGTTTNVRCRKSK